MKEFVLSEKESKKLGNKTEYLYDLQERDIQLLEITQPVSEILKKDGKTPVDILDGTGLAMECERLRRLTRIFPFREKQDALSYITYILRFLATRY